MDESYGGRALYRATRKFWQVPIVVDFTTTLSGVWRIGHQCGLGITSRAEQSWRYLWRGGSLRW
jgi:hypothetical protein